MPQLLQIHTMNSSKPPSAVQLHPKADIQEIARQLVQAVATDAVVEVPTVLPMQLDSTALYVRPKACAMWMFVDVSDDELKRMLSGNLLVDLLRAAADQPRQQPRQPRHQRRGDQ